MGAGQRAATARGAQPPTTPGTSTLNTTVLRAMASRETSRAAEGSRGPGTSPPVIAARTGPAGPGPDASADPVPGQAPLAGGLAHHDHGLDAVLLPLERGRVLQQHVLAVRRAGQLRGEAARA